MGRRTRRELLKAVELPLSAMPGGVEVGSFIHGVLEVTDFSATDLRLEIRAMLSAPPPRDGQSISETMICSYRDLWLAIETPLGPIVDGVRLRDIPRKDRFDERDSFELPLAGGDNPTGAISMLDVARVLKQSLRAGDPLHGYAERLSDPVLARDVRGFLDRKHRPRVPVRRQSPRGWWTTRPNRLAPRGVPLSAWSGAIRLVVHDRKAIAREPEHEVDASSQEPAHPGRAPDQRAVPQYSWRGSPERTL